MSKGSAKSEDFYGKSPCDECAHACFSVVDLKVNEMSVRCAMDGFKWQPKVGFGGRCVHFRKKRERKK